MAQMTAASSVQPPIRLSAIEIVRSAPQHGFLHEIGLIGAFVRDEIRYVKDVRGVETLHWPAAVMDLGCGDCDDKAMLCAALLMSIGHECRFVVIRRNGAWCHVWTQALCRGKWINLDTTIPAPLGQTVPLKLSDRFRFQAIPAYDDAR